MLAWTDFVNVRPSALPGWDFRPISSRAAISDIRIRDEFACQVYFGMNTKIPNIEVIRSLWRRVKKDIEVIRSLWRRVKKDIEVIRSLWRRVKKGIKVRDLKPVKEVKGGGGLTGESKPITGSTGTADTTSTWRYVPKKRTKS
jgi:hypothetical protein